jgi:CRP-like cAMP-binding protein
MLATLQPIGQQSGPAPRHGAIGVMPERRAHDLEPLEPLAITIRADGDEEIVAQGDPAGYCYLIVSGCVRTLKLMEDGRRQIGEFLLPGDLFGWEALDEHDFGAEAVTPVTLLVSSF